MSSAYVLDASALLAMVHGERGGDAVAALLPASVVSSVNWSEVLQKAAAHGVSTEGMADDLRVLGLEISAFEADEAEEAARLWTRGAQHLSLGDRACLATALRRRLPALTADRGWAELSLDVEVRSIR